MVRRIRLGLKILMNQFNANLILITFGIRKIENSCKAHFILSKNIN